MVVIFGNQSGVYILYRDLKNYKLKTVKLFNVNMDVSNIKKLITGDNLFCVTYWFGNFVCYDLKNEIFVKNINCKLIKMNDGFAVYKKDFDYYLYVYGKDEIKLNVKNDCVFLDDNNIFVITNNNSVENYVFDETNKLFVKNTINLNLKPMENVVNMKFLKDLYVIETKQDFIIYDNKQEKELRFNKLENDLKIEHLKHKDLMWFYVVSKKDNKTDIFIYDTNLNFIDKVYEAFDVDNEYACFCFEKANRLIKSVFNKFKNIVSIKSSNDKNTILKL